MPNRQIALPNLTFRVIRDFDITIPLQRLVDLSNIRRVIALCSFDVLQFISRVNEDVTVIQHKRRST
jgi:hypothetical protein